MGDIRNETSREELAKIMELQDAFQFLEEVKLELSNQPTVYEEFLLVMKGHATNAKAAVDRVKYLFRGNTKLVKGFNKFLPEGLGYKIKMDTKDPEQDVSDTPTDWPDTQPATVFLRAGVPTPQTVGSRSTLPGAALSTQAPSEADKNNPNYARAVDYVTKIQKQFKQQNPATFTNFLQLLRAHHQGLIPVDDVVLKVAHLFAGHSDLQDEFITFLPLQAQDQARVTFHQKKLGVAEPSSAKSCAPRSDQPSKPAAGRSRSRKRKATVAALENENYEEK